MSASLTHLSQLSFLGLTRPTQILDQINLIELFVLIILI